MRTTDEMATSLGEVCMVELEWSRMRERSLAGKEAKVAGEGGGGQKNSSDAPPSTFRRWRPSRNELHWKRVKRSFRLLDNGGNHLRCTPLHEDNLHVCLDT